jgi:phosphoglycerate-specific signal transduction histidine kinase
MDAKHVINQILHAYSLKTDKQLAETLGISKQTVYAWKKRNTLDFQLLFEKLPDIDANFLLSGQGPVKRTENIQVLQDPNTKNDHEQCASCIDKDEVIKALKQTISSQQQVIDLMGGGTARSKPA